MAGSPSDSVDMEVQKLLVSSDDDLHNNDSKSKNSSRLTRAFMFIFHLIVLVIGMNGWRLDVYTRDNWRKYRLPLIVWALSLTPLQSIVVGVFTTYFTVPIIVGWAVFGYVVYYGSLFVIFSTVDHWRHRFQDQDRLLLWYYVIQGFVFNQQSFAVMLSAALKWQMADDYIDKVLFHPALTYSIAATLTIIGLGIKIAATHETGLDVYYYKDMFTGKPGPAYVVSGVYKYLESPMYGLGNCQLYATAILRHSTIGLMVGALCHCTIWTFFFTLEKPFVKRTYLSTQPLVAKSVEV